MHCSSCLLSTLDLCRSQEVFLKELRRWSTTFTQNLPAATSGRRWGIVHVRQQGQLCTWSVWSLAALSSCSLQGHVCFSACLFGLESLWTSNEPIASLISDPNTTCSDFCNVSVRKLHVIDRTSCSHVMLASLLIWRVESAIEPFLLMWTLTALKSVA